jgi:HK97 family phage major capsid protein
MSILDEYIEQLRQLTETMNSHRAAMDTLIRGAVNEDTSTRALNDDEQTAFDTAEQAYDAAAVRFAQVEKQLEREKAAQESATRYNVGGGHVVKEDGPYTRNSAMGGGPSYFRDLAAARNGNQAAVERLRRNDQHVAAYQQRAGITTVNGAGGEFVPPLWLEEDFIKMVRPGRKTANLCVNEALPGGTDSINLPKISGGTAVAFQGTQNTGINETDITTTSVSAGVYTVAGGQTISLQLLEQSPVNIDSIILQDLTADYARFLDAAVVLNGSGTNQPTGILNLAGTTAVANSTVGAVSLYSKVANAIQSIQTSRYADPTHIVMHPRRWASLLAAVDSSNRPLVVPSGNNYNPMGTAGEPQPEGVVGYLQGLPVVTDANVPTNLGAGTNQDPVIVAKFDDLFLWEGRIRAEIFPQTYAANASMYARLYNYVAFQAARYPQSIAIVNGTGQVPPTF